MRIAPVCTKAVHLDNKISNSTVQPKKIHLSRVFFLCEHQEAQLGAGDIFTPKSSEGVPYCRDILRARWWGEVEGEEEEEDKQKDAFL